MCVWVYVYVCDNAQTTIPGQINCTIFYNYVVLHCMYVYVHVWFVNLHNLPFILHTHTLSLCIYLSPYLSLIHTHTCTCTHTYTHTHTHTHTPMEEKVVNQDLIILELTRKLNSYNLPMSTELIQDNRYHLLDLWITSICLMASFKPTLRRSCCTYILLFVNYLFYVH